MLERFPLRLNRSGALAVCFSALFLPKTGSHSSESALDREQATEERPIALQRQPEVFRRDIVTTVPLPLEFCAFVGERLGKALHRTRHQTVGLFDSAPGLVDESGLNLIPSPAQALGFADRKQGGLSVCDFRRSAVGGLFRA